MKFSVFSVARAPLGSVAKLNASRLLLCVLLAFFARPAMAQAPECSAEEIQAFRTSCASDGAEVALLESNCTAAWGHYYCGFYPWPSQVRADPSGGLVCSIKWIRSPRANESPLPWRVFNSRALSCSMPTGYATPEKNAGALCGQSDCGNPINIMTGNKHQHELDLLPSGAGLYLQRTYNSAISSNSGFARGWTGNYSRSIDFQTDTGIGPANKALATLSRSDGKRFYFKRAGVGSPWVGDSDTKADLIETATDSTGTPTGWLYRSENNELEIFNAGGQLTAIVSMDGRKRVLAYSCKTVGPDCPVATPANIAPTDGLLLSVTDQFGRALKFVYDDAGRVSTMLDPIGRTYSYTYSSTLAEANLLTASYPGGAVRQYRYAESAHVPAMPAPGVSFVNALTGIVDELGVRYATWDYDANGRAVSSQHAGGVDRFTLSFGVSAVTVQDPRGVDRSYEFITTHNVGRNTGISGQPCNGCVNAMTYDAHGNVVSADDFNGSRTCSIYEPARNLPTVVVEGLSGTSACDLYTAAGSSLPTGSRKFATQWHPDWRVAVAMAEPGRVTTSVYNGQPDPFDGNAIASCAPAAAVLPDGKPIAVLCKQVEQATTDVDGSQGFAAEPDVSVPHRVRTYTYNDLGQMLTAKDPLSNTTAFVYYSSTTFSGSDPNAVGHTTGDLQSVTNALGHATQYQRYDKAGRLLQSADVNGAVSTFAYDERGRLTSKTVAGQATGYTYDPVGQLTRVTQPDGSYVGYEYDAAHRQVASFDQLGNRIEYVLDDAGNRTGENVKDPSGALRKSLARSFDALNHVQQSTGLQ